MRIQEIFIESFGAYRRMAIGPLGPGVTIIVGSNEAGKTTLLEFVRSVFFGFRKRAGKPNTYETLDGVPRRGWVSVVTDRDGCLRISRNQQHGAKEGVISVTDDEGRTIDAGSVPLFQANLKRSVYESLFAFDLDQMRQLDHETLRCRIMAAALGSTRLNPLDVRKQLAERLKKLTRRSAKDPESLWAIQTQLKELGKRLRLLEERPKRHSDLKDTLDALEVHRADLTAQIAEKETLQRRLASVMRFEQEWLRLTSLDRELESLKHAVHFPAEGVLRLERYLDRRRETSRTLQELEQSIRHLKEQLAALRPAHVFLRHSDDIQSILRESRGLSMHPSRMEALKASIHRSLSNLSQEVAGLGEAWNLERVREFDPSLVLEQEIRGLAHSWSECWDEIRGLRPRLLESSERCNRLRERIAKNAEDLRSLLPQCEGFLSEREREKLRLWKGLQEKISSLHAALQEKTRAMQLRAAEREDVSIRIRMLRGEPASLISPAAFWAVIAVLGSAAIGMLYSAAGGAGANLYLLGSLGFLAVATLPMTVAWKMQADKRHRTRIGDEIQAEKNKYSLITRDLAGMESERRSIRQRIQELSGKARDITEQVLGKSLATAGDVALAERRSARSEEPWRMRQILEDKITFDRADLDVEESRGREILRLVSAAEDGSREMQRTWASFLSEKGLLSEMDPEAALELVRRLRDVKKRLAAISEQEDALLEMQREWEEFAERVGDLGRKLGDPLVAESSPLDRVEQWSRMERQARDALSEKNSLLGRVKEHEIRLNVGTKKMQELDDQILALMEAAGVSDEESFREHGQLHERYEIAERDRRVLVEGMVAGLAMSDEHAMRQYMQNQPWSENRDRETALQGDLERLRQESVESARRSGMLSREIQALEAEDETERLLLKREELLARLKQGADEFIVTELASAILDKTLQVYESEKQPKVLERTSHLFGEITGNKYKRVLFPLDGEEILVERWDGERIGENLLSRGTLEQVYLSLRLAHLEVYHRDSVKIPLMMDDVLVNFDVERAAHTARALAKFSRETDIQVLFFTCHPHIARLFPGDVARMTLQVSPVGHEVQSAYQTGVFCS